jgi:DNA topoisomerase IB
MVTTSRSARLRRSDCCGPGVHRARRGRGFSYVDERGERVDERERLERIRALAIPPAWCAGVRARTRIERAVIELLEE